MGDLIKYGSNNCATAHAPSVIRGHLDRQAVGELDGIGRLVFHKLPEQRLLEHRLDVPEAHLGLITVDGEELHHAALAAGQVLSVAKPLRADGGKVDHDGGCHHVLTRTPAHYKPSLDGHGGWRAR